MAEATGARERVEQHALLWGLVAVVFMLSALPLVRLVLEGIAPGGRISGRRLRERLRKCGNLDRDPA
jgi:iron(III) transport system permease protein